MPFDPAILLQGIYSVTQFCAQSNINTDSQLTQFFVAKDRAVLPRD